MPVRIALMPVRGSCPGCPPEDIIVPIVLIWNKEKEWGVIIGIIEVEFISTIFPEFCPTCLLS